MLHPLRVQDDDIRAATVVCCLQHLVSQPSISSVRNTLRAKQQPYTQTSPAGLSKMLPVHHVLRLGADRLMQAPQALDLRVIHPQAPFPLVDQEVDGEQRAAGRPNP